MTDGTDLGSTFSRLVPGARATPAEDLGLGEVFMTVDGDGPTLGMRSQATAGNGQQYPVYVLLSGKPSRATWTGNWAGSVVLSLGTEVRFDFDPLSSGARSASPEGGSDSCLIVGPSGVRLRAAEDRYGLRSNYRDFDISTGLMTPKGREWETIAIPRWELHVLREGMAPQLLFAMDAEAST